MGWNILLLQCAVLLAFLISSEGSKHRQVLTAQENRPTPLKEILIHNSERDEVHHTQKNIRIGLDHKTDEMTYSIPKMEEYLINSSLDITSPVKEIETPQRLMIKQYSPSIPGPILENNISNYKLLLPQTALGLTNGTPGYTRERRPIQQVNTYFTKLSSGNQVNKARKRRQVNEPCRCPSCNYEGNEDKRRKLVNVVFNKPGRYYVVNRRYEPACAAVDGFNTTGCIHTVASVNEPLNHWLEYDLLDIYTFGKLILHRRVVFEGNIYDIARLKAMDISVDGEVCLSTPGYTDYSMEHILEQKVQNLECLKPVTGRFVRFGKRGVHYTDEQYHFIVFCEIIIWVCDSGYYGNPDIGCEPCPPANRCNFDRCDNYYGCNVMVSWNAAIKMPASQSSVASGGPEKAVDGAWLTDSSKDCTSTDRSQDGQRISWWQVNLRTLFKIIYVKITNRQDCCGDFLQYFIVLVKREPMDFESIIQKKETCHEFYGSIATGGTKSIDCTLPIVGQYVSLIARHPYILQFCEVRPYGFSIEEISPGKNCSFLSQTRYCKEGSTCILNKCRIELGGRCTDKSHCVDETTCEQGICVLALNAPCANAQSKCENGAVCDSNSTSTCKWALGNMCEDSLSCIAGTLCDPLRKCKIPINGNCANHRNFCQYRAICDAKSDFVCKWGMNTACQNTDECQSGLVCDYFKRCKIPVGHSCRESSECIGGASCQSSQCHCTGTATSACDPQEGRAGGPCSKLTKCVENSTCTDKTCRCDTGYEVSQELFSCKLSMGSGCQDSQECTNGLVCDGQICKMETGNNCGDTTLCKTESQCDSGICRIKYGNNCENFRHLCSMGSVCFNGFCKLQFHNKCDKDNDHCKEGTMCSQAEEDKTPICRISPGKSCIGQNNTFCTTIALCAEDEVCKVKPGESCAGLYQNDCTYGTKCDNGTCRYYLGHDCLNDEECETGTVCDLFLLQCRLAADRPCAAPPPNDMCSSGAICNSDNRCACFGYGATVLEAGRCEPASGKVGGTCKEENTQVCDDPYAYCTSGYHIKILVCQCHSSYEVERTNYTCGAGAGTVCDNSNITVTCNTGLICDYNGFCSLEIGQTCKGENRQWCKSGSVCEQDICRANFNQDCSGPNRDKCKSGTTCDALFRCKFGRNSYCNTADVCVAGSTCENNICQCNSEITRTVGDICKPGDRVVTGKCKSLSCIDPNAICTRQQTCECQEGYRVQSSDLSCKISVGNLCSVDESLCSAGTICDDIRKKCSLELGQFCGDGNEDQCRTYAVCDVNKECKLDFDTKCNGSDIIYCKSGTFCDWLGWCKIGVALLCNDSSECVVGATCVDSICQCIKTESIARGRICEPQIGYIGGSCGEVGTCIPEGSVCSDEICLCKNDFVPSIKRFICVASTAKSVESDTVGLSLLLLLAALAAACIVLIIAALTVRKNRKKEKAIEEMEAMKAERKELSQMVHENYDTVPPKPVSIKDTSLERETSEEFSTTTSKDSSSVATSDVHS